MGISAHGIVKCASTERKIGKKVRMVDDMCARCIFRAEHEVLHDAMDWCGMKKENAPEDLSYVEGVHDTVHKMAETLERLNGGAEQSTTES